MKTSSLCLVKKTFLLSLVLSTQLAFSGEKTDAEFADIPNSAKYYNR